MLNLRSIGAPLLLLALAGSAHADEPPANDLDPRAVARALSAAFRSAGETAAPSVVQVVVTRSNASVRGSNQPAPPNDRGWSIPRGQIAIGNGSGFILDDEGHIITSYHVIHAAASISVVFHDERRSQARLVGFDRDSDLAVLRVELSSKKPTPARFGDSDALQPGEWVLAIGSPFGVRQAVSAGIVSAIGRVGHGEITATDLIQTDAAMNPGSSGGPLVNLDGEVVGMNASILSRAGGFDGVGFALPGNHVLTVVRRIIRNNGSNPPTASAPAIELETPVRTVLGLGFRAVRLRPQDVERLRVDRGMAVSLVQPGTPAERAGLATGDVIMSVDGAACDSRSEIARLLRAADLDAGAELRIIRQGREQTVIIRRD